MRRVAGALSLLIAAVLAACGGSSPDGGGTPVPWPVTAFPETEPLDEASVALGRLLFYDPLLGADRETACATCHSEFWGMGDALPRSIGHGAGRLAGPGREGPNVLRRNAQPLWNLAFRRDLLWDGRAHSLEEQALLPLLAADELARPPEQVVAELAAIPAYEAMFAEAFPDGAGVTVGKLARALADFQRTFVSRRSLYDGYLEGDAQALSEEMREGMFRFAAFGCHDCHVPPLFEGPGFFDRAVPEVAGVVDQGRAELTGEAADEGAYRVPTLRNVAFSEPYFHNGSVAELEDAVGHELLLGGRPFDAEDLRLIALFLDRALRDESRGPERPFVLPSGLEPPLDGTRIPR